MKVTTMGSLSNKLTLGLTILASTAVHAITTVDKVDSAKTSFLAEVSKPSCVAMAQQLTNDLRLLQESRDFRSQSETEGQNIINALTDLRVQVRKESGKLSSECAQATKELFAAARALQDLAGIYFFKDAQIESENANFKTQPIPLWQNDSYRSFFGEQNGVDFQSGDIMITKGVSLVSSTISSLPKPQSLYSHIVFVHKDKISQETKSLESYIGLGVIQFDINSALRNENARIQVLRLKNADLAQRADEYIYSRISRSSIPYDYELDFNDNSKLSCEEIAYDAFRTVSNGNLIIPMHPASIERKDADFLQAIGLKNGELMAPADMELDPRFDVVYDWTDYRLMRDSWRKDATMSEMFRWMDQLNYKFVSGFGNVGIYGLNFLRQIPGIGYPFNKMMGTTADVPDSAVFAMNNIKKVAPVLIRELAKADAHQFKVTGMWMSQRELRDFLERFRKADLKRHLSSSKSAYFHEDFAPPGMDYRNQY